MGVFGFGLRFGRARRRTFRPPQRRIQLLGIESSRFARILHVGPYATEPESFAKIDAMLSGQGLDREPWHVEVYLSDPSRTAPEKLKTCLLTKVI